MLPKGSLVVAFAVFVACSSSSALGQQISDCDHALVISTYKSIDQEKLNYSMAYNLSKSEWSDASHNIGADFPLFGVPIGLSYDDYHKSASQSGESGSSNYSRDTYRNILWTKLDVNSPKVYSECLNALTRTSHGLSIYDVHGTDTDINFFLHYSVVGSSAPNPLSLKWVSVDTGLDISKLPTKIGGGDITVTVRRPVKSATLGVNADGLAASLVLTPLPPPPYPLATSCIITSGVAQTLAADGTQSWSCPKPLAAGHYQVDVAIKTDASPPGLPFRDEVSMNLVPGDKNKPRVVLPVASETLDFNLPGGPYPSTISASSGVDIPEGGISFLLNINEIYARGEGGGKDCCISVPAAVSLQLVKQ